MSLTDTYIFIGDELKYFINQIIERMADHDGGSDTIYVIDKLEGLKREVKEDTTIWNYDNLEWCEIFRTPIEEEKK